MIDLRKIFTQHFEIKRDCNLGLLDHRHVLVRLSNQKDFVEVYSKAISFITVKQKGMNNQYQSLFSLASAVGTPLQVDKVTTGKSRPNVARVKVEVNLLSYLPNRVRMFFKDEKTSVVKEVLQKLFYDKLPSYCTTCKHQGHKEEECRLTMEKKKFFSIKQTKQEVTLPTSSNNNSGKKNSVERVDAPGPLLVAATCGNKEDTKVMLPRTLTSKISEQLGTTTKGSSTPIHIDAEAQNNVDNNSRWLIVTPQVATKLLSSRFVKDKELGLPNAVVVTKSRQDEAKKGNTITEKSNNQWTLV
ncbi:hypothetical protein R3W88_023118 [Solanum pinnatisectum]|uniref:DUF4283 domain-containing protein n=1 Tax=Solanum pinnatisectum TaxID=50273 RepID=A0AAV9LZV9_9SOLN|nr:hypothetical protein R3W88_023118 [Solanum pinnatisectum]